MLSAKYQFKFLGYEDKIRIARKQNKQQQKRATQKIHYTGEFMDIYSVNEIK